MKYEKQQKIEYLLDTSALIAYLANEKESSMVVKLIEKSALPFIALSEIYYVIFRKKGEHVADNIYGIIKGWNIPILLPDDRTILLAGRFKASFGMGLADSYIAALSYDYNLQLLTKDRDYTILKNEINIIFL